MSAILLSLLPAFAGAASHHRRPIHHWRGYGFLPGYRQPPNNHIPIYGRQGSVRGIPDDAPMYWNWYNGDWYYFGRPGFFRGRYNGGSLGPCWTQTPIGPIWNCG